MALFASMERPAAKAPGATYNIADDEPAPRAEVMAFAAQLLGVSSDEAETEAGAPTTARARRRERENSQCRTR